MTKLLRRSGASLVPLLAIGACSAAPAQAPLIRVDLTEAAAVARWQPAHDVSRIEATSSGMAIHINGTDPYILGPRINAPSGKALILRLRLRSEAGGTVQVFFFEDHPSESQSVTASVPAKKWTTASMPLPPLTPATRLRLDPPGTGGICTVSHIELVERAIISPPRWSKPAPVPTAGRLSVRSGPVTLAHAPAKHGAYEVTVGGLPMATGWSRLPVAYSVGSKSRWVDLAAKGTTSVRRKGSSIETILTAADPDGGRWSVVQRFTPAKTTGVIEAVTEIRTNRTRRVSFLPMLALFPGASSFGTSRERGLFAGLEYLDRPDRSSSEDDLRGLQAQRLVPDAAKITFPLMAMQARNRYIGVIWEMKPWLAAAFDTPDRSFGSGANAMAILFPGSDGFNRSEGSLIPYDGRQLDAGYVLRLKAQIIGGPASGMVPAIQKYVALHGLPAPPRTGMDRSAYARWTAGGWLDSKISEGARFRHAYWPDFSGFAPHPAADAALWMHWCAAVCGDAVLADRLQTKSKAALSITEPATRNTATVSHVTYPVQTLLFGDALAGAQHAHDLAKQALSGFAPDGTIPYRPSGGTDYGTTHFEKHANGLTATVVARLLNNALVSGDPDLITEAIQKLRGLDRYRDSAPRGAQTWEVPLHTPDILASAYLTRAYTLGYELTGDQHFLGMAKHWAWTGLPFVYLVKPVPGPIGLYATIAVYGATNWVAPNWMGLPVQWCGLVYSDALYRLARYDQRTDWKRIADGITASGIQQSWPSSDRDLQGLLPDSVTLKIQNRNAVAINPGTVQANAVRLFGGPEVYDYHVFRKARCVVHAPGAITRASEETGTLTFAVRPWAGMPAYVLVSGLKRRPQVTVNGTPTNIVVSDMDQGRTGRIAILIPPAGQGARTSAASIVRVVIKL
mgnify:CR=1 FL=1